MSGMRKISRPKSNRFFLLEMGTFLLILLNLFLMASTVTAQTNVLVTYHSETGNTEKMAKAVAKGARSIKDVHVKVLSTDQTTETDLLQADAIIVGSPVHNSNVSSEMQWFIESWPLKMSS